MKKYAWATLAATLLIAAFGTGLLVSALNRDSEQPTFIFLDRVAAKIGA